MDAFVCESALYRCYGNVLPVFRPFHRLQGWTGCISNCMYIILLIGSVWSSFRVKGLMYIFLDVDFYLWMLSSTPIEVDVCILSQYNTSAGKTLKLTRQAPVILLCFDISGVSQLFIIFIIPEKQKINQT